MANMEKAIRILEGNYKSFVLRHNGELLTVNKLIALLKAQEPRVMTDAELIEEIQKAPLVLKPAVDAVPVKWLREKIKEHTDEEGWQDYLANSFGLCIEEWQKEQEAR